MFFSSGIGRDVEDQEAPFADNTSADRRPDGGDPDFAARLEPLREVGDGWRLWQAQRSKVGRQPRPGRYGTRQRLGPSCSPAPR